MNTDEQFQNLFCSRCALRISKNWTERRKECPSCGGLAKTSINLNEKVLTSKEVAKWLDVSVYRFHNHATRKNPSLPVARIGERMSSEVMRQILQIMESEGQLRLSAMEYEMAYQARVVIDRIRFAIKQTEQAGGRADQLHETAMQLLGALNRLESVERWFQQRLRYSARIETGNEERLQIGGSEQGKYVCTFD